MGTPGVIVRGINGIKRRAGGINRFNAAGESCCCDGPGGCGPYLGIAPSTGSCFDPTKQRVASLIWSVDASYLISDRQNAGGPAQMSVEAASMNFQVEIVFGVGTPAPWTLVAASGTFSASRTSTIPGETGSSFVGSLSATYGNLAAYLAEDSRGRGIWRGEMAVGMQFAGVGLRNSSGLVNNWRFGTNPGSAYNTRENSDEAIRAILLGAGLSSGPSFARTSTVQSHFPNLSAGDNWYGLSHIPAGSGKVFQTGMVPLLSACGSSGSIDSSTSSLELVLDYTQTYSGMGSYSMTGTERRVNRTFPLIRRDATLNVDQTIAWQPCG